MAEGCFIKHKNVRNLEKNRKDRERYKIQKTIKDTGIKTFFQGMVGQSVPLKYCTGKEMISSMEEWVDLISATVLQMGDHG